MLTQTCDSCKNAAAAAPQDNPARVPDEWTRVLVDRTQFYLCPGCAAMPMQFGHLTMRLDKTPATRREHG